MGAVARHDLMDRLGAVLPRMDTVAEARRILGVMARICRADLAAVLFQRGDDLQWFAGDPLPEEVLQAIQKSWRLQTARVLSGIAYTETPVEGARGVVRARVMWVREPADGGLDAVYFEAGELRPLGMCALRLPRLAALLARVHGIADEPRPENFTEIG